MYSPWGCSSLGRALEWHSRGSRFDPDHLHHIDPVLTLVGTGFLFFQSLQAGPFAQNKKAITPFRVMAFLHMGSEKENQPL